MKNLLKLPVLLLSVMLVVSCGDSKKEEEEKKLSPVEQAEAYGVKMAELECELMIANDLEDWEKMDEIDSKIEKIKPEVEEKMKDWGEDSEEAKAAEAAFEKEMENCQEKRAEAEEKAIQEKITKLIAHAKKVAELECELEKAYAKVNVMEEELQEISEELSELQDEIDEKVEEIIEDGLEEKALPPAEEAYRTVLSNCKNSVQPEGKVESSALESQAIDESWEYDSEEKAYEDAEVFADLLCEYMKLMENDPNSEKTNDFTKKVEELSMELEKIYGPNGSASEEAKAIFEEELEYLMDDCM